MTVAIDARWMIGEFRGMGHYANALVESADRSIVKLLPGNFPESGPDTVRRGWGFFPYWEQSVLPGLCRQFNVTQLVCPYNTAPIHLPPGVRLVLVVHDLIYLESWRRVPRSTSIYQTLGRIYRRWNVPRVARSAHRLITVSEFSRKEICERFGLPRDRVQVIPNSLSDEWFIGAPLPASQRAEYLLTVSGEAPHKNLSTLLRAFAQLRSAAPDSALTLRIVGVKASQQAAFKSLAAHLNIASSVVFERFLEATALRELYQRARLFVFPSLIEGFGIPVLEAMASGTPVACSNSSSLPEVVDGTGWLFDPANAEQMSATLQLALGDESKLQAAALAGLQRAQRYRRSAVTNEIREFWRTL
ncbi:glycosyltransferase family 4 protein [Steroidobacter sp. S1-65]|uniref:Glycosyltransferase family 4 protein n=1 Tax=Steroidobacter gossypii TaxID=2805490 RepID=A0ABS1WYW3_9GAMM|nr:glycosyltransferase family 1 protein [Steroidobacter gossypii]MBM0106169.1 glycosyltransferase family 4 protein [Steroidobacter gossypii]